MAVIYLRHPVHGAKVAISHMEVEHDTQNGWEEYDPNNLHDGSEPVNELQPRRRSRKTSEVES